MSGDGGTRRKTQKAADSQEVTEPDGASAAEAQERTSRVTQASDEMLDEIDEAMRAALQLAEDASDEEFNAAAKRAVDQNIQKGGQ